MKLPGPIQKLRERLLKRWSDEDYPGGTPRFQLSLLAKDIAIFGVVPLCAVIFFKMVEASMSGPTRPAEKRKSDARAERNEKHSQIIQFQSAGGKPNSGSISLSKRAPGTLVRVKLMNVVETFSSAPVHAQIIDNGLGREFLGATIVGDATAESGSGRIAVNFKFVRHSRRVGVAVPISARALSLDGTYGVTGTKKEGLFARAATRAGANGSSSLYAGGENQDLKTMIVRAVAAGLMQEFQSEASTAHNNAQVLTLKPMTEFFVELTDYFPGQK